MWFNSTMVVPAGLDEAPEAFNYARITGANFVSEGLKGTLVLGVAAVTIYLLQRTLCLSFWVKSVSFFVVAALYGVIVCALPLAFGAMMTEVHELRAYQLLYQGGPVIAAASPVTILGTQYWGRPNSFPSDPPVILFYGVHTWIILVCIFVMRRLRRKLRLEYLSSNAAEAS